MIENLFTPSREIKNRIAQFQKLLTSNEIDGGIIIQNSDLFYFTGTIATGFLYIPAKEKPTHYVKRNFDRASVESRIEKRIRIKGMAHGCSILREEMGKEPEILGLELDVIPANLFLQIKQQFPKSKIVDISKLVKECRKIKSQFEIAQMRKAAEISKSAFQKIPSLIKEGMTEIELSALIEYEIRRRGNQGLVRTRTFNMEFYFGPVVSGVSANYPISFDGPVGAVGLYPGITQGASRKRISAGEPILIDFVTGYNGYLVDMARTFALGNLPSILQDAHHFIINDIVSPCEEMIKPGVNGKEIYKKALEIAGKRGYSENFMGLGENRVKFIAHGIGLELDEVPILAGNIDVILEPSMTFAFEPKVFIQNIGGTGVENTYLVTESGFENLTEFPHDITKI